MRRTRSESQTRGPESRKSGWPRPSRQSGPSDGPAAKEMESCHSSYGSRFAAIKYLDRWSAYERNIYAIILSQTHRFE